MMLVFVAIFDDQSFEHQTLSEGSHVIVMKSLIEPLQNDEYNYNFHF